MKVKYKDSIEYRLLKIIKASGNKAFLRSDFSGLGSYRQVSRALNKLIERKKLVKIGQGLYARAFISKYIDEPVIENGFDRVAREALDRLQVIWEPGSAEQAYNAGETQQIPTNNIVRLRSRLRRKVVYMNRELKFEGKVNAR